MVTNAWRHPSIHLTLWSLLALVSDGTVTARMRVVAMSAWIACAMISLPHSLYHLPAGYVLCNLTLVHFKVHLYVALRSATLSSSLLYTLATTLVLVLFITVIPTLYCYYVVSRQWQPPLVWRGYVDLTVQQNILHWFPSPFNGIFIIIVNDIIIYGWCFRSSNGEWNCWCHKPYNPSYGATEAWQSSST